MKKLFLVLILFLIIVILYSQDLSNVEIFNGPNVMFIDSDENEYVSLSVFVKLGNVYPGIAHLAEHLIFASNSKMKGGDFDFLCEKIGATCDAYTNYDYSVYKIIVKNTYLTEIIKLLSFVITLRPKTALNLA